MDYRKGRNQGQALKTDGAWIQIAMSTTTLVASSLNPPPPEKMEKGTRCRQAWTRKEHRRPQPPQQRTGKRNFPAKEQPQETFRRCLLPCGPPFTFILGLIVVASLSKVTSVGV